MRQKRRYDRPGGSGSGAGRGERDNPPPPHTHTHAPNKVEDNVFHIYIYEIISPSDSLPNIYIYIYIYFFFKISFIYS